MDKDLFLLTKRVTITIIIFLVLATIFQVEKNIFTNKECKNYIIEHQNELKLDNWGDKKWEHLKLDSCDNIYYTDIIVRFDSDSSYNVIFWGDRNSWKWRFKTDKYFSIDIPYNRYKKKNIDLDVKLYNILNNIK